MENINAAQYDVAKAFLNVPVNVSIGSRVAVLIETRLLSRTGTTAAVRIVMARARLFLLPPGHPAAKAVRGVEGQGAQGTWLEHSARVMRDVLGVMQDVTEFEQVTPELRLCAVRRKGLADRYRQQVVLPRAKQVDAEWFQAQFQKLVATSPEVGERLVIPRGPWLPTMVWAPWSRTVWKFFRAWVLIRITGSLPLIVWGVGGLSQQLLVCPLCGTHHIGISHLLDDCESIASLRTSMVPQAVDNVTTWAMQGVRDVQELRHKVVFVGIALARLAKARMDRMLSS